MRGLYVSVGLGIWLWWMSFAGGWAYAQTNTLPPTVPNMDLKHFDPAASPYGLWGLQTSKNLDHLAVFAGLMSNYANDLLVLQQNGAILSRPIQHRITTEVAFAIGLFQWVELGVALPIYWRQISSNFPIVQNGAPLGEQGNTGLGDLRLRVKVMLVRREWAQGFGLSVDLEAGFPSGGDQQLMRNPTVVFHPRVVLDYRHESGFVVALNAAFRLRGRSELFDLKVDDELRFGLGVEVPLFYRTLSLVGEVESAVSLVVLEGNVPSDRLAQHIPTELRVGARWRHEQTGLMVGLGAGIGLTQGYSTPDVRIMLSLGWSYDFAKKAPVLPFNYKPAAIEPAALKDNPPPPRRAGGIVTAKNKPPATYEGKLALPAVGKPSTQVESMLKNDPNADNDGDGIPNAVDKCPNEPEDFDGFEDHDGCPDPDNDRDGIPDKVDKCPLQKEVYNGVKDDDGCPDKGKSKIVFQGKGTSKSAGSIKISEKIYFNSGSDQIQQRSIPLLRELAGFLKSNWQIRLVQIQGHTDSQGDAEMNVDLSERRARQVMAKLVSMGVSSVRLKSKGYGAKFPVASNRSRKGRAQNRRVVFKVLRVVTSLRGEKKGGAR
ncbi:MAG: hypothetical protein EP343_30705 [Deltaproteobacteria bacterium]|nr:MAG: hypothetical protein EP343_30705 [Deltaproteobacteria bacterium]